MKTSTVAMSAFQHENIAVDHARANTRTGPHFSPPHNPSHSQQPKG
jgi:hypothetical protein